MTENKVLKAYAIRSSEGNWYSHGSGYGIFTEDIQKVRLFSKPGPPRGIITKWAKHRPQDPTLDLVEFTMDTFKVIDEQDRVKDSIAREAVRRAENRRQAEENRVQRAYERLAEAQREIDRLQERESQREAERTRVSQRNFEQSEKQRVKDENERMYEKW